MSEAFTIDPDVARAETPPKRLYQDPAIFARAIERAFAPGWHFVGDVAAIADKGSFAPRTLLEGCLDEPLLFVRDEEARLGCFANVCTHRGTVLCERAGRGASIACRYHGRRFGLDGRMRHMPEFDGARDFPRPADDLARVHHGALGPLLFACASKTPRATFDAWIGEVVRRVGFLPLDRLVYTDAQSKDYRFAANWALYCDNYLEGFHIPFVHPALARALDWGAYENETFEWGTLQIGIAKPGELTLEPPPGSPDHKKAVAAYYFWLFPGTMLNFYPWGLSVNVVTPLGPADTRVRFVSYVYDASKLGQGAGGDVDTTEMEDEAVVLAVQRGLRSRHYERGRYSPTQERGVHHFHRLLARELF